MRNLTLLCAAVLAVGCVRTSTNPATGKIDVDVESPTKKGEDWKGKLIGQGQYMAITGNTSAQVSEGMTTAMVSLYSATAGSTHPWHIHEGKCGSGGPIVGDPMAYPPLVIGDNGTGSSTAKLNARLNEAKDYSVNVHASSSNMETIIACGMIDD